MEPDILDRLVGVDDELIAGAANVSVFRRVKHFARGRCGVVIEDLGECLVKRRRGVGVAVEVGSGAEDVEALAQAGLRGERPAGVSRI